MLVPTPDGHYPHLDIWRSICIGVVVLDHGNPHYSEWNLFFGQSWTLQAIFIICGLSFGLSKRSLSGYVLRLAAYVFVGVMCNWVAFVIIGKDWRHDPWNVVFQFWFVVGLILYSLLLVPLRRVLVWCRDRPRPQGADPDTGDALKGFAAISAGLLSIFTVLTGGFAQWVNSDIGVQVAASVARLGPGLTFWAGGPDQAGQVFASMLAGLELTLSNVWLAVAIPVMFPAQQSVTGWVLVVNLHARRLLTWYSGLGEKALNGFDLMLLGLVCYYLGLKYRRPIGKALTRYWPVWFFVVGVVWKPGTHGRMDRLMGDEPWAMRWRMRFIDTVYMTVALSAGDRLVDPGMFTEDRCHFINNLGLFLFLVHKAIHLVLPPPWNWLLILSFVPIFSIHSKLWRPSQ